MFFKSDHIPHVQVSLLAALKVLGVTAGVLLTRNRNRGRRDVMENMVRSERCGTLNKIKISD
jgi:hypothetical protein